jgi:tRNA pseudouridine38-40 synthase
MHLKKIALIVEYDGAQYHGFQLQAGLPTVQGEIERAIAAFTGETLRVACASRTDAGVSAAGQVVTFRSASRHGPETFTRALNHYLRDDVAVLDASEIPMDYDVRVRASAREYRYLVLNRRAPSPIMRNRAYWIPAQLDFDAMRSAAALFLGEHDFVPFAGPDLPPKARTRKTLTRSELARDGDLITFDVIGDSFLHQQVRRMAGAVVEVGLGKVSLAELERVRDCGERGAAGPTLPAHGLTLLAVRLPELDAPRNAANETRTTVLTGPTS